MSTERRIDDDLKFIETCVELRLLNEADAETLRRDVLENETFAAQQSLQRGLLTASDVDIVYSLRHPLEVVPGYEILGLVGRGGMGVVYRAKQIDLDRIVALKTVLISNVHSPTAAARFEREAKTLARLQHPNIVQALNFGQHLGRYYFAMEFVLGRSCEQALQQEGRLDATAVWSCVRQVASGLMHALRQNVIHRDIKPANLLLLPAPEGSSELAGFEVVKITDFGLAMFADEGPDQMRLTTGDKIMGSPAYMSPEQFGGETVDFRADIYSLGATAWHLLFGSPPFQGKNLASLLSQKSQRIQVDRSALPVQISDDQWQLLLQMLEPDENDRPASYESLVASIDRFGVQAIPLIAPAANHAEIVPISDQPTMEAVMPSSTAVSAANPATEEVPLNPPLTPLSPTLELPSPTSKTSARRRFGRPWWWAAIGVTVCLVMFGVYQSQGLDRGPRRYTRVIESSALFDGVTLSGWDVGGSMVGAWNTVEAPDASTAIACTARQGALTRRVDEKTHPRISLFVWPQPGFGMIDIDFALQPREMNDVRGSLRFTPKKVLLGQKLTDFGALSQAINTTPPPTLVDRYHVVHLERQPNDWYVFLEQQLIGTIPIDEIGAGTAIRIVVHPSADEEVEPPAAYFAEVRLDNLAEPDK